MRVSAISLRRRPDRWSACEAHLRSVLPTGVAVEMFEGTDAKALAEDRHEGEGALDALERGAGITIYRDWPITEVEDVRRAYPRLANRSDVEAWVGYERAVAKAWRGDRARLYVDFFMRHLTLGDIGAAVSHVRLLEHAHSQGVELQLVFEDDARPTAAALPALEREVALLEEEGVGWDLIYLHSAQYCRGEEPLVHPRSALRVAGHRKVCHAYAVSRRGLSRLTACGMRDSMLPIDDLLPALHSVHPRDDVMALPCVRAGRGDGGDGGGPFVALTFPDDALLVLPPKATVTLLPCYPATLLPCHPATLLTFPDDAHLVLPPKATVTTAK